MQKYCEFCRTRQPNINCQCCENKEPYLLKENTQAVSLFLACLSQFRTSFAGITGLDYTALEKVSKWLEIPITKEIFYKIQILEKKLIESVKVKKSE